MWIKVLVQCYTECNKVAEEWHHAQVCAEAAQRQVVVEVLMVAIMELQELAGTPEVDQ